MAQKVGFIGLGQMGKWMALNVLKAGFPLMVHDIRPEAVAELTEQGAEAAGDLGELARSCGQIILSLPDAEVVRSVLLGEQGLEPSLSTGQLIIDCSTTNSLFAQEMAKRLRPKGVTVLDAPISGMQEKVREGRLTIMIGGEEAAYEAARPLLAAMGNHLVYLGGTGNGQLAKTLNNVLFDISCAAMAEILPVAVKMGIPAREFCSLVSRSSGQSYGFDFFAPLTLERNFSVGYSLDNAYKDMANLLELATLHHIPLPVTSGTMHTYQLAQALGHGAENKGAMIKVWEQVLGVRVEAPPTAAPQE
ncbi:2-hydroxymethylglutarate dehydrogenase [Desulfoferula mesophila]|uniref:2-hydroxymethylglutarate dehydrogenase n=2 Tax=Desulfoferula mesophila TaxID=3058419 RepID=A0AAU9ESZ7_9BACT|nr:2-hydroxymethylglutarate dehydrogenase [Desulfoferula mesophilus]